MKLAYPNKENIRKKVRAWNTVLIFFFETFKAANYSKIAPLKQHFLFGYHISRFKTFGFAITMQKYNHRYL